MIGTVVEATARVEDRESIESILRRPAKELKLFRLQCAKTANGLSHYYMYGDLAPEKTLL